MLLVLHAVTRRAADWRLSNDGGGYRSFHPEAV